ncbi:hypothetical protein EV182_003324, partial [Spiromyces aspiralis]
CFDYNCLDIRYGEIAEEEIAKGDWICPKCRDICNCSICRRKKGKQPTGPMAMYSKYSFILGHSLDWVPKTVRGCSQADSKPKGTIYGTGTNSDVEAGYYGDKTPQKSYAHSKYHQYNSSSKGGQKWHVSPDSSEAESIILGSSDDESEHHVGKYGESPYDDARVAIRRTSKASKWDVSRKKIPTKVQHIKLVEQKFDDLNLDMLDDYHAIRLVDSRPIASLGTRRRSARINPARTTVVMWSRPVQVVVPNIPLPNL